MKGFTRPFFSNFAISEASPSTRAVLSSAREQRRRRGRKRVTRARLGHSAGERSSNLTSFSLCRTSTWTAGASSLLSRRESSPIASPPVAGPAPPGALPSCASGAKRFFATCAGIAERRRGGAGAKARRGLDGARESVPLPRARARLELVHGDGRERVRRPHLPRPRARRRPARQGARACAPRRGRESPRGH